ncbi:MAG: hypothetical protein ACKOAU_13585, partial [Pirellula sp.]
MASGNDADERPNPASPSRMGMKWTHLPETFAFLASPKEAWQYLPSKSLLIICYALLLLLKNGFLYLTRGFDHPSYPIWDYLLSPFEFAVVWTLVLSFPTNGINRWAWGCLLFALLKFFNYTDWRVAENDSFSLYRDQGLPAHYPDYVLLANWILCKSIVSYTAINILLGLLIAWSGWKFHQDEPSHRGLHSRPIFHGLWLLVACSAVAIGMLLQEFRTFELEYQQRLLGSQYQLLKTIAHELQTSIQFAVIFFFLLALWVGNRKLMIGLLFPFACFAMLLLNTYISFQVDPERVPEKSTESLFIGVFLKWLLPLNLGLIAYGCLLPVFFFRNAQNLAERWLIGKDDVFLSQSRPISTDEVSKREKVISAVAREIVLNHCCICIS